MSPKVETAFTLSATMETPQPKIQNTLILIPLKVLLDNWKKKKQTALKSLWLQYTYLKLACIDCNQDSPTI